MTSSDDQTPEHPAPPQPPYPPPYPQQAYPQPPVYAQQPPYPQQAYPQPPYGQPPYGQAYPQTPYPQPPYGQAYPTWPGYGPPEHPKANLAFVLGLVGGPGAFLTCGLSLLAAPFAWYFAMVVRRDVAAVPGQYSPETSKVTTGLVLGIIGTALLALAFVLLALVIVLAIADPGAFDSGTTV